MDTKGAMELMSIMTEPCLAPSRTPSLPRITSSESAESGSMVITMSARDAASAEVVALEAPSAANSSTGSVFRLWRTREWPAFIKLRAMGFPMIPRPMNPMLEAIAETPPQTLEWGPQHY